MINEQSCRNDGIAFCDHSSLAENEGGLQMENNFRKNGRMVIRFETVEERAEIIRILEKQRGFQIDDKLKQSAEIHPYEILIKGLANRKLLGL